VGELELPPAREPTGETTVTYHMNRLQALTADREFCVTLNRTDAIDPAKILRTIAYATPCSPRGARAQARHHEISGRGNRTHYAGRVLALGVPRGRRRQRGARGRALRGAPVKTMYAGTIRHRRFAVTSHEFRHRVAFAYLDLDALPRASASTRRSPT
jgi:hypothetical protein